MVKSPRPTLRLLPCLALVLVLAAAGPALAHTGVGYGGGFTSGFLHPVLGWDHVAAMVAVGLWGAFLGMPAIWVLPVVFPLVMAFGAILGILDVPVPAIETGIAASAVVLGALIAMAVRAPLWIAAVIVGSFAIFHGYAHGAELPESANAFAFAVGFVIATGLLHLTGIAFGMLVKTPAGEKTVRAAGAVISLAGVAFLFGWV
ncbi:HupE/UreJ family protein [Tropicimonas sp. IMCC34043]|uniref:HupE/UreJ family protein n=1 Tax=Tropicimonas sp. IMCC34043 TaxID=2248760 RepID=UPI000E2319EA|nr:HupE/UreJ family protein [Tropicimonas sp. IMCC34043]